MKNRINLILLNKPWILLVSGILYLIIVQKVIGYAECYWDFPYEKIEAAKSWSEEDSEFCKSKIQNKEWQKEYAEIKESWKPLDEIAIDKSITQIKSDIETIILQEKQVNYSQIKEFNKIRRLYIKEPVLQLLSSNHEPLIVPKDINMYINELYIKVYKNLQNHLVQGTMLTDNDVKKIVFDTIMTNPNNNVWIISNKEQLWDHNQPLNILLHIYGKHHAMCKTQNTQWIIGTIATTTSIIQHNCLNVPIEELNTAIEKQIFNDKIFNAMSQQFLIGYSKK